MVPWLVRIGCVTLIVAANTSCNPTLHADAGAHAARPGAADRLLARLAYVRADYPRAVVNGAVVDRHELEEQSEILEEALEAAQGLPLSRGTRAALGAVRGAVGRTDPAPAVTAAIDAVDARLRDELWLELAPPDASRLDEGAALYAAHCASCHGAGGEGPPAAMAALRPPPPALLDPSVSGALSPRRVYATVTFGVPETAMVGRGDTLSEAERWTLGFFVAEMTPPSERAAAGPLPLEELATTPNAALRGARDTLTRAAAASPLLPVRAALRAAAQGDGDAAAVTAAWAAARPAVDPFAAARIDAALADFTEAARDTRRSAAERAVAALADAERAGSVRPPS